MKFAACCLNTEKERLTVFQVYAFNVTNSASWLAGREALRVEEVGPFVYRFVQEMVTMMMIWGCWWWWQKKRFEDVYQIRETWWRTNVEEHQDGQVGFFWLLKWDISHFRSATTWSRGIAPESNLFGAVFNCASQGGEKSGQIKYLGEVSATLKQHHSISPHSFVSCNC